VSTRYFTQIKDLYRLLKSLAIYNLEKSFLLFPLGEEQNLLDVIFVVGSSNLQSFLVYRDLILTTLQSPQTADTKYGVITYSSSPTVFLRLKDFVSKENVVDRLRNIPWQGSGSDLEGALRKADEVFTNEGRLQARKVLLVYGDGRFSASLDNLTEARESLEEKNIKIIPVTVTDNEEIRKKLDEVATTDEDTVIVDPEKPEKSTDDINERTLKGMLSKIIPHHQSQCKHNPDLIFTSNSTLTVILIRLCSDPKHPLANRIDNIMMVFMNVKI
jgi:vacuolar-type H+-ATPase subunit F/Vma7